MRSRSPILLLLVFLTACGSGDAWYESKDYGQWAKSHPGTWYGTGEDEEEDSWWCKYMGICEEEKSPQCTLYGNCDEDGDGIKDADDKDSSASCAMYGNCKEEKSSACSLWGNCDKDSDKKDDAKESGDPMCTFYGNC